MVFEGLLLAGGASIAQSRIPQSLFERMSENLLFPKENTCFHVSVYI